jgi:putative ABC transport system substrate-binding protein
LNRPGGNVTGISVLFNVVVRKQVEMLSETAPTAGLIGFLVNPANSNAGSDTQDAEEAALVLGRRMIVVRATSEH